MLENQNQPPMVTIEQTTQYQCGECGNGLFDVKFMLRKASKLQTGYTNDMVVPIQVYACNECGTVADEFLPDIPGLKSGLDSIYKIINE